MLSPEKEANLIFEGNYNSTLFNNSLCKNDIIDDIFYKLDTLNIREDMAIMNISLNCVTKNNENNYLMVKILYSKNTEIINNILIANYLISKEINIINNLYNNFKINDFPFWLYLYNKDNKENKTKNITSDYLKNFL